MNEAEILELYEGLKKIKVTKQNQKEVEKIKQDISNKEYKKALEKIRELNQKSKKVAKAKETVQTENGKPKKKTKKIKKVEPEKKEAIEKMVEDVEKVKQKEEVNEIEVEGPVEKIEVEEAVKGIDEIEVADDFEGLEYAKFSDEKLQEELSADEQNDEWDNSEEEESQNIQAEEESIYPEELRNRKLEYSYLGLILNNPKFIAKYYVIFKECLFDSENCLNIYKGILFTEGSKYTPEVAKQGFNFPKNTNEIRELKIRLQEEYTERFYNIEKIYVELKKLFTLRKSYIETPLKEIQDKIVEITQYELYDLMSEEEVKSAINQVNVTGKFKQAILNIGLTEFLEMGDNTLTNGLQIPFPILSSVFKGIRKGETFAFAMPSNSGKSRFTINLAAYTAFVHKKKVLIISNEMSEDKMRLCLITTILNNPEIQKIHGQKIRKTEGELLEFKFRPDDAKKVKVDEEGFIVKKENEDKEEFAQRLLKESTEFRQTIEATKWVNEQIDNSIYFINITDHTNDELKKVIMNYYYKEKIEYIFYDTLKTDTANIGNGEEIKKTATILSNLAQNFNLFICSTLQLTESTTPPINLNINDLAVSRTVKEVLDTLCLIKQIDKDTYEDYEYSLKEVDTEFFDLKKHEDPNVRYYACIVDKNRAGAKPKVLFKLNLAYNQWEELGYLKLKQTK